jgi:hypothetical protein
MLYRPSAPLACLIICAAAVLFASGGAQAQGCSGNNLVPETDFCLAGTTVIGSGGVAVFKTKGQSLSVETGETVGSWRVTAIKEGSVTIQRGAVRRELEMNRISTASRLARKKLQAGELHDISPVAAGKAASVGTSGPGPKLSISTHLPPVKDY